MKAMVILKFLGRGFSILFIWAGILALFAVPGFPIHRTGGFVLLALAVPAYLWLRRFRHEDRLAARKISGFSVKLFAVAFALVAIILAVLALLEKFSGALS